MAPDGTTRCVEADKFVTGYRKTAMLPGEFVLSCVYPLTAQHEYVWAYKQTRRRDDDITLAGIAVKFVLSPDQGQSCSSLSAPLIMRCCADSWKCTHATVACSGVAPTIIVLQQTPECLIGHPFNKATLVTAIRALANEVRLPENVPGALKFWARCSMLDFVR